MFKVMSGGEGPSAMFHSGGSRGGTGAGRGEGRQPCSKRWEGVRGISQV